MDGVYLKISKNYYKGSNITDHLEIIRLANEKKSIYHPNWGIKPAAIILSMQFRVVLDLINRKMLYYIRHKNELNN